MSLLSRGTASWAGHESRCARAGRRAMSAASLGPAPTPLQVNQQAKVSVKLVAQAGIGTVASGVAKANADIIQVGRPWWPCIPHAHMAAR